MAALRRIRATWSGVPGTPYLSTWYFDATGSSAAGTVTAVRTFLTSLAPQIVTGLSATVDSEQFILDDQSGEITDVEVAVGGAAIAGSNGGEPLPYQTQGVLKLVTGGIVAGRRVRGRFYVPGPSEAVSNPTPLGTYNTVLQNACNALITATSASGPWSVWSRPVRATEADPDVEERDGSTHHIVSGSPWSKWGIQRRRRD